MGAPEVRRIEAADSWVMKLIETATETIGDAARIRRLTEFAIDAAHLADQRLDLDLRALIDDLHRDLIELEEDR
jgi:hypothetical protein